MTGVGSDLTISVDGRDAAQVSLYGDVEMSTVWPGGSDQLIWTVAGSGYHRFRGGALAQAWSGGVCRWGGLLDEPDPSQDQMTATGLWQAAQGYSALDGSGNATLVVDTAIDQAIARGLPWTRPTSIDSVAIDDDISQGPLQLDVLLDSWSKDSGARWGVTPLGAVYTKVDDTTPTWQTRPQTQGLGYARDTYASTLVGRYQASSTPTYATSIRTNTAAETAHGHVEAPIDLTPYGVLTATKANNILDRLLAFGRATPGWTQSLDLSYGELLTMGETAVALEAVAASGNLLRVQTGWDLGWRRGGNLYLDVPIGRTSLAAGILTITPQGAATATLADFVAQAVQAGATKNTRRH